MTNLASLFASLPLPSSARTAAERTFSVCPVPGRVGQLVARSADDHPTILVETSATSRAPIMLQNLRATFSVRCSLVLADHRRDTLAAVIECLTDDANLRRYFLMVAGHVLEGLGPSPRAQDIVHAIDTLASLFQRLTRPPTKDAQGLFGELIVIDLATEPSRLLEGWHVDPLERFDFVVGGLRLEVKTSRSRQRRHQFSLEQCMPPHNTIGVLASAFIESAGGGLSLEALAARTEARLAGRPELVIKLHAVLAETLGLGLLQGLAQRFDEHLARARIAFYDLSEIPAIRGPLPVEISGVRFTSEFGRLPALNLREAARRFAPVREAFLS